MIADAEAEVARLRDLREDSHGRLIELASELSAALEKSKASVKPGQ
jgi:hypothetical protein